MTKRQVPLRWVNNSASGQNSASNPKAIPSRDHRGAGFLSTCFLFASILIHLSLSWPTPISRLAPSTSPDNSAIPLAIRLARFFSSGEPFSSSLSILLSTPSSSSYASATNQRLYINSSFLRTSPVPPLPRPASTHSAKGPKGKNLRKETLSKRSAVPPKEQP